MDNGRFSIRHDERGLSLVEVLMAVTIMAIISTVVMSYFISAMEKSADESRRIIAINLARQMQQEARMVAGNGAVFAALESQANTAAILHQQLVLTPVTLSTNSSTTIKDAFKKELPPANSGVFVSRLAEQDLNGIKYRFRISLEPLWATDALHPTSLARFHQPGTKLLRMRTTVYWLIDEADVTSQEPSARMSASLDSYLVQ